MIHLYMLLLKYKVELVGTDTYSTNSAAMLLLPAKEGDQREGVEATVGVLQEQSNNRGKTMLTTKD
jgi:hypothetical protein